MDKEIGELIENPRELCVDWRIPDFLSLPEGANSVYCSPLFLFSDAAWYLQIYPHGRYNAGVISLYLHRDDEGEPRSFSFSVGFRKADGKVEELSKLSVTLWTFGAGGFGDLHFLDRSKLQSQASQLVPSGVFTVTCKLESWVGHPAEVSLFRRLRNLSVNLKELLRSGEGSDVVLRTKGGAAIPAHKAILRSRSPALGRMIDASENRTGGDGDTVFGRLFDVGATENRTDDEVNLEDEEEGTMRIVLRYVYGGQPDGLWAETACDVYVAAHKYDLPELRELCTQIMRENMSPNTICDVIAVADSHQDARLMKAAKDYFANNKAEITKSDQWAKLKRESARAACEVLEYSLEHKSQSKS